MRSRRHSRSRRCRHAGTQAVPGLARALSRDGRHDARQHEPVAADRVSLLQGADVVAASTSATSTLYSRPRGGART